MKNPQFQIINAAAGSGKTFSLVLHYLERLIASKEASPFRYLLALTFTNKAVNEVKARILDRLYALASQPEKETVILKKLSERLNLTTNQIQDRSERILRKILQEYASFDVVTLDKFTHRVIRTFAKDFKLPYGFEVAIDSNQMLTDMVLSIIDRVGTDPEITAILYDFSLNKIRDQKSWNIQNDLLDFAKVLLNENDRIPLSVLKSKSPTTLYQDKKYLEDILKSQRKECIKMAREVFVIFKNNGLEKADFYKGTLYAHFQKIESLSFKDIYSNQLQLALEGEKPLYTKTLSPTKQDVIDALRKDLYHYYLKIKVKVEQSLLTESILQHWTPLSLLHVMEHSLDTLQKEQQRMLLAQFNAKISALIVDQPAPFIYERLGERYRHYFIDEFQDTSELQWKNLIPLIGNALETEEKEGQGGSLLLVGDPKQAIYRWRGGNIAQFILLLEKQSPFQVIPEITLLPKNYRSKDRIVEFNNAFFKKAGSYLQETNLQKLFCQESQQETNSNKGGFVRIDFIPETKTKIESEPLYLNKTHEAIKSAIAKGFQYKDITVLVRKKKHATLIGESLSQAGIGILSSESLVLNRSKSIQFLIALFRLTGLPDDHQQHKVILDHLWDSNCTNEKDYHNFISSNLSLPTRSLFTTLGFDFDFNRFKETTLYSALELAIAVFPFIEKSNTYIVYFLENVFEFSNSKSTTFRDYLNYWDMHSDGLHIAMPEGLDAVQIMTVHKAKGLEFPVVILPFLEDSFQPKITSKIWYPLEDEPLKRLDWGWINFSKKLMDKGPAATDIYKKEAFTNELDAFTVLYVALTRAVAEIYIITQHIADTKQMSYAHLFKYFAQEQGVDLMLNATLEWQTVGVENKMENNDQLKRTPLILSLETSNNWQERLIAQFDNTIQNKRSDREWGILIHQLLKEIRHAEALEYVLQETVEKGLIQDHELDVFKTNLEKVIYHPKLYPLFSSQGEIFNEHDILVPNGKTLRPDRVVQIDSAMVIIDYKTGSPKEKDKKQLEEYAAVIKEMGFTDLTKHLVYIQDEVSIVSF